MNGKYMQKRIIVLLLVTGCLLTTSILTGNAFMCFGSPEEKSAVIYDREEYRSSVIHGALALQSPIQPLFFNDTELIDEYTWSVMRYDHESESENFGVVSMPKPSPGAILVPTNMISMEVCRTAVSLYHENKIDTLEALEEYDINNMVVGLPYIMWRMRAEANSLPCYKQKSSAHEMGLIGERCIWADFVGDCYSQALFNTAVLRLCGFSPEEVFTLIMPMHGVTIVKVENQWHVFDSVKAQFSKSAISESYHPPAGDIIYWIENDKYFINFGTPSPEAWPYQDTPFSNIDPDLLIDMVERIVPMFNNSALGAKDWEIYEFIENAIPSPDMATNAVPYTVEDATGSTIEEKAQSLLNLNVVFILNQTGGTFPNQYDRSLYSLGLLSVEYPQAYANAAKLAAWTSWCGSKLDSKTPYKDIIRAVNWINLIIKTKHFVEKDKTAFTDFTYLLKKGSTIDKAIVAYGTLRNMKKNVGFWQPEDLYVLITGDYNGYLAVNVSNSWEYLTFGDDKTINTEPPENLKISFNENEYLSVWEG